MTISCVQNQPQAPLQSNVKYNKSKRVNGKIVHASLSQRTESNRFNSTFDSSLTLTGNGGSGLQLEALLRSGCIRDVAVALQSLTFNKFCFVNLFNCVQKHLLAQVLLKKILPYTAAFLAAPPLARSVQSLRRRIPLALVWFRNDLRLHDHEALRAALLAADKIVPVYIFDLEREGFFSPADPPSRRETKSARREVTRRSVHRLCRGNTDQVRQARRGSKSAEARQSTLSGCAEEAYRPPANPTESASSSASCMHSDNNNRRGEADHGTKRMALSPARVKRSALKGGEHSTDAAARAQFLIDCVADLRHSLRQANSGLLVRTGAPERVLPALAAELGAGAIFSHGDVAPLRREAEEAVSSALESSESSSAGGCALHVCPWSETLLYPGDCPFQLSDMPTRYDVFRRAVQQVAVRPPIPAPTPEELQGRFPPGARMLGLGRLPTVAQLLSASRPHVLDSSSGASPRPASCSSTTSLERRRPFIPTRSLRSTFTPSSNSVPSAFSGGAFSYSAGGVGRSKRFEPSAGETAARGVGIGTNEMESSRGMIAPMATSSLPSSSSCAGSQTDVWEDRELGTMDSGARPGIQSASFLDPRQDRTLDRVNCNSLDFISAAVSAFERRRDSVSPTSTRWGMGPGGETYVLDMLLADSARGSNRTQRSKIRNEGGSSAREGAGGLSKLFVRGAPWRGSSRQGEGEGEEEEVEESDDVTKRKVMDSLHVMSPKKGVLSRRNAPGFRNANERELLPGVPGFSKVRASLPIFSKLACASNIGPSSSPFGDNDGNCGGGGDSSGGVWSVARKRLTAALALGPHERQANGWREGKGEDSEEDLDSESGNSSEEEDPGCSIEKSEEEALRWMGAAFTSAHEEVESVKKGSGSEESSVESPRRFHPTPSILGTSTSPFLVDPKSGEDQGLFQARITNGLPSNDQDASLTSYGRIGPANEVINGSKTVNHHSACDDGSSSSNSPGLFTRDRIPFHSESSLPQSPSSKSSSSAATTDHVGQERRTNDSTPHQVDDLVPGAPNLTLLAPWLVTGCLSPRMLFDLIFASKTSSSTKQNPESEARIHNSSVDPASSRPRKKSNPSAVLLSSVLADPTEPRGGDTRALGGRSSSSSSRNLETLVSDLLWRDFFRFASVKFAKGGSNHLGSSRSSSGVEYPYA